jgi:hypothetical protein
LDTVEKLGKRPIAKLLVSLDDCDPRRSSPRQGVGDGRTRRNLAFRGRPWRIFRRARLRPYELRSTLICELFNNILELCVERRLDPRRSSQRRIGRLRSRAALFQLSPSAASSKPRLVSVG